MNYYEHHLGDYAKDVRGLSMTQEGAYRRLLDAYYSTEQPLPSSLEECCDIAGSRSKSDSEAVAKVLEKFFHQGPDGRYHQKRVDAEISRFRDKSDKAVRAARSRWKDNGEAPPPPSGRIAVAKRPQSERNADALQTHSDRNADAMRSQSPVTSNQTPIPLASLAVRATAGEACKAMRTAGLADVSPSHPTLIAMVEQGASADEFANAAAKALKVGKGFGYALGIVKGDREDAARMTLAPSSKTHGLARFALPPGAPRVLPDELSDDLPEPETNDVDAHRARG